MASLQKQKQTTETTISRQEALSNLVRYRMNFGDFVREILEPEEVYFYQDDILKAINEPGCDRIAWHKGHGVGGTTLMAWLTLAFLFTRASAKVVTTASVNRQVRDVLWPEIHRWMRKAEKNLYKMRFTAGYDLLDIQLKIQKDWYAIGASSDEGVNMEGFHAPSLMYIVDEAKTVKKEIFESIEGALTGVGEAKLVVVSTPPYAKEGHFYDICRGAVPGFRVFHTSGADSPNVSKDWIESKKIEWGENSPAYISKVLGLFPDSSDDTLIPLSWVDAAIERWQENVGEKPLYASLGVDVARYGSDETVLALMYGPRVEKLMTFNKQDTMQTTGQVVRCVDSFDVTQVNVDVIGVGAGVCDRLREISKERREGTSGLPTFRVKSVNVAAKAPMITYKGERLRFKRLRDRLYWNLRIRLDPQNPNPEELLSFPNDDKLRSQLTSLKYKVTSDGAIEIENKDSLKARGYNSPDRAEAIMLGLADGYGGWAAIIADDE